MFNQTLRSKIIRLAHAQPALRPHLLPILRQAKKYPLSREFFVPSDNPTLHKVKGSPAGLEIFTWENLGKLYGAAFAGRSSKPLWFFTFLSESSRRDKIEDTIKSYAASQALKKQRSEERKQFRHGLSVGDILYSSWGYDQTNVNWYEVIDLPSEKVALLREVAGKVVRSDGRGNDQVVPVPGSFIGPVLKRIPQGSSGRLYVKVSLAQTAYKWDGKPKHETSAGFGH